MKKTLFASTLTLGLFSVLGAAYAASTTSLPTVTVYDGKTLAQDNLAVSNWGGGTGEDSTQTFLFGGHSLKVTTLDLYQGALVSFVTPLALPNDSRVFQVTFKRGDVTLHYDPQTTPGAAQTQPQNTQGGYPGGYPGAGYPGAGYPGGIQGGRGGRRRGGGQFGGGRFGGRFGRRNVPAEPLIPLISKVRLQFTLTDGRQTDVLETVPTTADPIAGEGWYSVNVPLSSLKFGAGATAMLKSVTLAGDQYGILYVGRMQITVPSAAVAPAAPEPDPQPEEENPFPMGGPFGPGPVGGGQGRPGRDD